MFRLFGWLFGFAAFLLLGVVGVTAAYLYGITKDLPDYRLLKNYQPPVTTRVHAADGTLLAEYARERRLFQPIETIPPLLVHAFLSAEDKDFYTHGGIDVFGIVRELRDYVMSRAGGGDAQL